MASQPQLPPGYTPLETARQSKYGQDLDVIGLISDCKPTIPTRNGAKLTCTFELVDEALYKARSGAYGLRIRFFVPTHWKEMPEAASVGDVIMLRGLKRMQYNGQNYLENVPGKTEWCIISQKSIPTPQYKMPYLGGRNAFHMSKSRGFKSLNDKMPGREVEYIIHLKAMQPTFATWLYSLATPSEPSALAVRVIAEKRPGSEISGPPPKAARMSAPARTLMSGIAANRYFDMTVEIVKTFDRYSGEYELCVTDYTQHEALTYYTPPEEGDAAVIGREGDPFGQMLNLKQPWAGPYGRRVLRIIAKPPHGPWAIANVVEGDIIDIKNVKITVDQLNSLEGTLWPDWKYSDKIQIWKCAIGSRIQELEERKKEYLAERSKKEAHIAPVESNDAADKATSRSAKQKQKKRERKQQREAEERLANSEALTKANSNVRCSHTDIPLSDLEEVLDKDNGRRHIYRPPPDGAPYTLPFVNANFRAKVSVIDFRPDVEDFAYYTEKYRQLSPDQDDSIPSSTTQHAWQWSFRLQVKDEAGTTLLLHVAHAQAEFLLGSFPDAGDLRQDRTLLAKLKERLFILWGNLEELKSSGKYDSDAVDSLSSELENRAFECCIAEYGTLMAGGDAENINDWERRFMMHGVTII